MDQMEVRSSHLGGQHLGELVLRQLPPGHAPPLVLRHQLLELRARQEPHPRRVRVTSGRRRRRRRRRCS